MKPVRAISEKTIPKRRTFCWSARGTRKLVMMMRNTKRLSTERAFSVTYPAKYSDPASVPPNTMTPTPNSSAIPTYRADHVAASRSVGVWALRTWK